MGENFVFFLDRKMADPQLDYVSLLHSMVTRSCTGIYFCYNVKIKIKNNNNSTRHEKGVKISLRLYKIIL